MSASDQVIIVSGLPRSGTSMMMRMLEAGGVPPLTDGLRTADDDNREGYYEFEPIKQVRKHADWMPAARGKAVKAIYQLLYDLPPDFTYQVIYMNRKLEEVVASQRKMLANLGQDDGIPDAKMIGLFRRQVDKVKAWIAGQPNFSLLDVDYNALVADARPGIEAVCRFLDRPLDQEAMAAVVNPQHYRNRR